MGVVYLATQLDLDRPVALKVFSIEDADVKDPDKLFNEARAAGALSHANIVQVYSAGRAESGIGYFAMEYVAGETLGETIKRETKIDVDTALKMAQEIANALEHGWRRLSLTHGDIKPDNVMLTQDGVAKLADFGLARAAIYDSDDEDLRLTPLYAAPEMITGEWQSGDSRADMYSFGAMLHHMLVGQPPFPGDDPQDVMHRQVHDRPVPLSIRAPDIPQALSEFVDKLLSKSPSDRPESWAAIADQISRLRSPQQNKTPPHSHSASHSRPHPHVKFSRHADSRHLAGKRSGRSWHRKKVPPALVVLLLLVVVILVLATLVAHRLNRGAPPSAGPPRVNRRDTEEPESSPTDKGRDEKTVKSDDSSTPDRREEDLDAARTLAEERQMAPTPEERTKSLPEDLETVEEEPKTPEFEAFPEREEEIEQAQDSVDPEIRERLAADAYNELVARIVGLQWDPGADVPSSLHAEINAWIEAHGKQRGPSAKVQFLKNRVLPAAEEYIRHLVLQHEQLQGKSLPEEKFSGQSISKLTREGVEMARELPFGRSTTMHKWSELGSSTDLMIHLGAMALEDEDLPITELRPFLATLLLSGRTDRLLERLRPLPDNQEAALWSSLAEDYDELIVEKQAAKLLQAAKDAAAQGNPRAALRALKQLRKLDARFVKNHAEEIEQLEKSNYQASPQSTVARKTEDILRRVDEQPDEALVEVAALFADFGALDFPEKPDAITARRKALQAIAENPHRQALMRGGDNRLGSLGKDCLNKLVELKSSDRTSTSTLDELLRQGYRAGILLDIGDWMGSVQVFPYSLLTDHAGDIVPSARIRLAHIGVRLANRYSPSGPSDTVNLSLFDDVAKALADDDENTAVEAINQAFTLGLECGRFSFQNWKTGRRPPDIKPWAYWKATRQEQFLLQFAWMVMHGHQREAKKMAEPIIRWAAAAEELPSGPFFPMLRRLYDSLAGETPLELARMPQNNHPLTAPFWRAAMCEILVRDPQTIWDHELPNAEQMAAISGAGALQASLWADLVVLKLARLMTDGDMDAAAETAAAFEKDLPRPVLSFLTELRFYRAGIELFRGHRAAASDMLKTIARSGLAASDERQLADYWHKHFAGRDVRFSPAGKSRRVVYYHLWLKAADKQSEQTRFARARALKLMAERAPTHARAAFCRKLTTLFDNK